MNSEHDEERMIAHVALDKYSIIDS